MKTTYIDRRNSAEEIFGRASYTIRTETRRETRATNAERRSNNQKTISRPPPKPLRPISEELADQHVQYVAHFLREHHTEPTRASTFNSIGQFNLRPKNRVGGMRKNGPKRASI